MSKKINQSTGEITEGKNTFACFRDFTGEGEKDFDQYYIERSVKQVVQRTGDGEDDFIIVNKEIENKVSIRDSIQAQSCDAGIDAYLRPYLMSGEKLPNVQVTEEINDFSNAPENLAEAIALGEEAKRKFSQLDPKLTKGKSYDEFLTDFTQKAFNEWIESIAPKEAPKEGE
ncbi:MAG: hypothetical protein MJ214_05515 [Bacilli bacterium]|nr:hypothetical protein [Bacilli bacterium]